MTTVAAIDCGTHSIRLLIADIGKSDGGQPVLNDLARRMEVVRLGQDVDKTGELNPQAIERTLAVLREYWAQASELGASKVRMVATSATRDASNKEVFVKGVREIIGVAPEVIDGKEEASLSFTGSVWAHADLASPKLVVDIGGGSTELSFGNNEGGLEKSVSLNMGCVRVTERFFQAQQDLAQPILPVCTSHAKEYIDSLLDEAEKTIDFSLVKTLMGTGGSITTVTALALGLDEYDPDQIDGAAVSVEEGSEIANWLRTRSRAERLTHSAIHPGRIDVIAAGALVWERIVERVASRSGITRFYASEHDILDGIALSMA
ncbi:MAG: Ppx/GppA phosphatase family protein [Actinomycetaceae bacterium]|nr:Ppx/GppA phosphatase family protein [Actinomycetaceae bacterium]